jgi:putative ABC transport system substrate-binding protein
MTATRESFGNLRYLDVQDSKDIEPVFQAAAKGRAEALLVLGNPILNLHRQQVIQLAAKHRLPTTYARPEYREAGGLMTYGTNYPNYSAAPPRMLTRLTRY